MSDEKVKEFVRNTLGCDCAEEVFSHIENERDIEIAGVVLKNKINIGNRLLVYIVEADGDIIKKIPALVEAGKNERDTRGFNRFRLVLVSDDKKLKKQCLKTFKDVGIPDERIHLHIVGKKETADL